MQRVFFKAAGCAGHSRLTEGSWCCSALEERRWALPLLPVGPGGAAGGCSVPAAMPQWGLAFGAQDNSLMLFNADGADGYPSHPGLTCRNGSREGATFAAVHSITSSLQPAQARAPQPKLPPGSCQDGCHPAALSTCCLAGGETPAPHSPSPVGTRPLLPAGKVTCSS